MALPIEPAHATPEALVLDLHGDGSTNTGKSELHVIEVCASIRLASVSRQLNIFTDTLVHSDTELIKKFNKYDQSASVAGKFGGSCLSAITLGAYALANRRVIPDGKRL